MSKVGPTTNAGLKSGPSNKGLTVPLPISKRLPSKDRMVSKQVTDKLDKEKNMQYLNNLLGLKKIN